MSTVYWFKLPSVIKEKIASVKTTLVCLDDPEVDAALDAITWFKLPENLQNLVTVVNSKLTTDFAPGAKKWFKLEQEVERYFEFLDGATCV